MLVLRQAMPPDSHLSNNAALLWHRDQNRDRTHGMKAGGSPPKLFGHIGTQDQPAPSPWLVCVEGQVRARCSSWLDQAPGSLFERRAGVFPSMVAGRGQGMRLKWELGPSLGIFCWLH